MAHEIDFSKGFAAMAYVGETPWHGLGQQLQADATIEQWQVSAGMDFGIEETPVQFLVGNELIEVGDRKVLYRSDNQASLAVVSNAYQVVQPKEVLEFYRDLTEKAGFTLETAGVLRQGRKYWALASMGQHATVMDDELKGYLLLGTACDGSMATTAMFTSVRVVCNNTLGFAMQEAASGQSKKVIRVNHRSSFDENKVKSQLGIATASWNSFLGLVSGWSQTLVTLDQADEYFSKIATYQGNEGKAVVSERTHNTLMYLFEGDGIGMDMEATKGTAWGLINAVTEYVDHHRGRSKDTRMERAWFGDGVYTKDLAVTLANELVAA